VFNSQADLQTILFVDQLENWIHLYDLLLFVDQLEN
jgi:hypothetical protein